MTSSYWEKRRAERDMPDLILHAKRKPNRLSKKDKKNIDIIAKLAMGKLILIPVENSKYMIREATDFEKQDKPIGVPDITDWINKLIIKEENKKWKTKSK